MRDARRCLVELCREHGFVTGAELVLHKGNIGTLRESVRTLGELGAASLKVNRLNCVGEGAMLTDYAITCEQEYEAYLEYIPHYVEDGMPVPILTLSGLFSARHGRFRVSAQATDGTDPMAPDPDACLFFRGGYYDRAQELIGKLDEHRE